MVNYQNGKIYKITAGELTYIGSTCEPTLARRLAGHVGGCKRWKAGTHHFYTSYPLIETGQYEITLVELWPCTSKDELTARERFHIESNVCVNKNIPGRTHKEYDEANADRLREQRKAYYEANKDTIHEKKKTYRETNADALQDYHKAYRLVNRDEINKRQREARAKKKSEANA